VRYLQAAAAEADRLVVAVNDDASAGREGAGAADPEGADGRNWWRLRGVDYVTSFRADRRSAAAAPAADVHCKGTDYTVETVPERETCAPTAGGSRSSATRRTTRRATCSRAHPGDDGRS
jgi:D-glycero-beta-D-manno-heptose 1-phosphate adenylyltransferase